MMAGEDDNNGDNNDQDADLWAYVTRDVDPIDREQPPDLQESYKTDKKQSLNKIEKKQDRPETKRTENVQPGRRETEYTIDRRTDQRLRRGQLPIEGRIDLHGFNREQARQALTQFLMEACQDGKRCVLVITGKGLRSGLSERGSDSRLIAEPGILKQSLPEWLREDPLSSVVLAFHKARSKHGGDGAFYVLLRRKR